MLMITDWYLLVRWSYTALSEPTCCFTHILVHVTVHKKRLFEMYKKT